MSTFKSVALFIAAPFIGLLYALLLPIVGLGMLAYLTFNHDEPNQPQVAPVTN